MTEQNESQLKSFLSQVFASFGAKITPCKSEVQVHLPKTLRAFFSDREHITLAFGNSTPSKDAEIFRPGSRSFDALNNLLADRGDGMLMARASKFPDGPKPGQMLTPQNCKRISGIRTKNSLVDLEAIFQVSYLTDERQEELVIIEVPYSGPARRLQTSLLESENLQNPSEDAGKPHQKAIQASLFKAQSYTVQAISGQILKIEEDISKRLENKMNRLLSFYGEQANDSRNHEKNSELNDELQRKLKDEISSSGLSIDISLLQWCAILRPVTKYRYRLEKNNIRVSVELIHDSYTNHKIGHTCESCEQETFAVSVCESKTNPHPGCPQCISKCTLCDVTLCRLHGLSRCEDSGALLCPEHSLSCYRCRKVLSVNLQITCEFPYCNNRGCSHCSPICVDCGKRICTEHSTICYVCHSVICSQCSPHPLSCGHTTCSKHSRKTDKGLLICSRCRIC